MAGCSTFLFQLHRQNSADPSQTQLVAQFELTADGRLPEEFNTVLARQHDALPEGWALMLCDDSSEHFVWAAQ